MTIDEIKQKSIGFVSLGCDKNRVDLEKIIYNLSHFGFKIENNPSKANIIIVNTCAFLESARSEAIENILEMSEYKQNGNLEKLIVTGCINELGYSDLKDSLPEVDDFINIKDNEKIVDKILNLYDINTTTPHFEGRILTTPNHYAYLKISEGCNNFCSYCLIPYIRGRYKSRTIEDIMLEAKDLENKGVKELIIVAQDVTKYGSDIYGKKMLVNLIQELSKLNNIKWIRLLYCYPEELDDDLISEIANNPKVVKYLDIPLQHVSSNVLKNMNRKSTNESIKNLFSILKHRIPNLIIRTTFILGFPGETDKDIELIKEFLEEFRLYNVGFFIYSREEGTRAFNFDNQIDEVLKLSGVELNNKLLESIKYVNEKKSFTKYSWL